MAVKNLTVLGSTGSIGQNTLDVAGRFPELFRIHALAVHSNIELLRRQIELFRPRVVTVYQEEAAEKLRETLSGNDSPAVLSGIEGLIEISVHPEAGLVVSGMVGAVGLRPVYAAIEAGKQVAIANKEALVLAGELLVRKANDTGSLLLPMDSEHNAIFQCMAANGNKGVDSIILTASGGPFRDLPVENFPDITKEQALAHPNWKMGPKITIDSATMMNKGLEVIEAKWLFGMEPENIRVLIHRQSIVHSLVEFIDGSVIAQLGLPDMRTPIAYCLSYPERLPMSLPRLNLAEVGSLEFEEVSEEKYPSLFLALAALKNGGGAPAVLNGANEIVVAAYLEDGFPFTEIAAILKAVMKRMEESWQQDDAPSALQNVNSVDDAITADKWGRDAALTIIDNL